eukprot:9671529-Alexandrium_andersonii.AAC.1
MTWPAVAFRPVALTAPPSQSAGTTCWPSTSAPRSRSSSPPGGSAGGGGRGPVRIRSGWISTLLVRPGNRLTFRRPLA